MAGAVYGFMDEICTDRKDRFMRFSRATDAIIKNLQRYKNEKLQSFGLKSMHLMFLYNLDKAKDGLTAGELSDVCGVDKAFISRMTAELRKAGYVAYSESKPERFHYRKKLILTEYGKKVMESVNNMIKDAVAKISDGVSSEQIEIFYDVLYKLDTNLSTILTDRA